MHLTFDKAWLATAIRGFFNAGKRSEEAHRMTKAVGCFTGATTSISHGRPGGSGARSTGSLP